MARSTRAVILAGGETRNPLTRYRAMPSVPLGSSLILADIPINNCLTSGINKIYVLTQFQSQTLNSHIASSYPPVRFSGPEGAAWVDVLAAQQTVAEKEWYRGSADAIRRNIYELKDESRGVSPATDYVILSGAAVYSMDIGRVVAYHRARNADITLCTHTVDQNLAQYKGIVSVHQSSGRVLKFEEKPSVSSLANMRLSLAESHSATGQEQGEELFLANMGIYVFKREALFDLLTPNKDGAITHIGHHVIPNALAQGLRVHGYQHHGFWRDVSTLRDYYETNLALAATEAPIKMFEVEKAVAAKGSMLPPAQMQGNVTVNECLLDEGVVLVNCTVSNSVVGENVYIGRDSVIESSLLLGSPFWTNESTRAKNISEGERVFGVGNNCHLRGCIVDENASIGDGVKIVNAAGIKEADCAEKDGFMIQDGIVVVMRNAQIPAGTVI